jgi:hypothetical protein
MSQILPIIRVRSGEGIGNEIFIQYPDNQYEPKSFFDSDVLSGSSSLNSNGLNFLNNQYLVLGIVGNQKTEIVQVTGSPTSSSISIVGTTSFTHNRGDIIKFIPYNQVVLEFSTDSGNTFTALSGVSIQPYSFETYIQRTGDASSVIYRARFYNSQSNLYSSYSAQETALGYADNSVASIIRRAMLPLNQEFTSIISYKNMLDWLNEGRREVDQDPRVLKWPFRFKFNSNIGTVVQGQWSVAVPTDLKDQNTALNIIQIRIGIQGRPLDYQDDVRFRYNYLNIAHTTVLTTANGGATSIAFTESGDFTQPTGSATFAAQDETKTNTVIAYTANNTQTNVITVPALASQIISGTDVWQQANFGEPTAYNINNNNGTPTIYFDLPFGTTLVRQNIYMDYYKTLTQVTKDSDLLDEPEYDFYVSYLRWKIKYARTNGRALPQADADYAEWTKRKEDFILKQLSGQDLKFWPQIPRK